jgi:hypothetical protein
LHYFGTSHHQALGQAVNSNAKQILEPLAL